MNADNFCFWLQGFFEMNPEVQELNKDQTKMLREHLQLVFNKVTSEYGQNSIDQQYCNYGKLNIVGTESVNSWYKDPSFYNITC